MNSSIRPPAVSDHDSLGVIATPARKESKTMTAPPRTGSPEATAHSAYRKIFRRIVPVIMLMYLLAWLDRVNIGFAALTMNKDIGLSDTAFGLGAALFFVGYFIFEVPSNVIMEKVGARMWLARIMITWGLVSAATAFVVGEVSFYAVRILLGITEAGFFPGVLLYLTFWVPRALRGRITALFLMAAPLATAIGAPIASLILAHLDGFLGLKGWQVLFLAFGLPTALVGVAVFWLLPSKPADAKWLTADEKAFLHHQLALEQADTDKDAGHSTFSALKSPKVLALAFVFFGIASGSYLLNFFLPQVVASFKTTYGISLSVTQIGLISAIPFLCAALVMYFAARRSDRTQKRVVYVSGGTVIGAVALALSPFVGNPVLAIVLLSVTASCVYIALPLFWQLPPRFLTAASAAAGIALINSVGNLSGFVWPYATGALKATTGTFTVAFVLVAATMFIAAVAVIALDRSRKRQDNARPSREEPELETVARVDR
ncbi:permease (plasmid) [Rhodococcus jostii RHA1]|uniref:Permease n=2 Tax=Rhodococcus jostii TaxID=132919 RepID=Q0RXT7_RHOJR|nr:permease [Rhodococcus jostii RHA1]